MEDVKLHDTIDPYDFFTLCVAFGAEGRNPKPFGSCGHFPDGKKIKLYGWGLSRENRGDGERKQGDVCAVNPRLGGSTVFLIPPEKTPGLCVKVLSGKVYPRCLRFGSMFYRPLLVKRYYT